MRLICSNIQCFFTEALLLFLFCGMANAQELRIGSYEFPDGAIFQGELFRGKPYGHGVTRFQNGDVHEGMYVKGKRQGQGTYIFADTGIVTTSHFAVFLFCGG